MTNNPNFASDFLVHRMLQEEALIRGHENTGQSTSTALVAQTRSRTRPICSNCKRPGHLTDFYIQPGGKMAGKTVEGAKAAQRAASGKPPQAGQAQQNTSSVHVATTDPNTANSSTPAHASIITNGISYMPMPSPTAPIPPAPPSIASADSALTVTNIHTTPDHDFRAYYNANCTFPRPGTDYEFHAFVTMTGPLRASVDWGDHSKPVNPDQVIAEPVAFTASRVPISSLKEAPFFLDTGASTCHISPERSDFKTLRPISSHPVSGVGGACVYASGIGTVELCVAAGHKIVLENVLSVPTSTIRLISVLTLNRGGRYTSRFDSSSFFCWVTNPGGATILRGIVYENRRLYGLSLSSPRIAHSKPPGNNSFSTLALYASRTPDIETWHRRLGHCNNSAIINMARRGAVEGMVIDLSFAPPKC
jgi:hypothetical protein